MAKETKAESMDISKVGVIQYYNDNIVPLKNKLRPDVSFRPMSDSRVTGICPFHGDSDPSFHYWAKKNIGHCFGCGWGGNVIRIHQSIRRLYYGENLDIRQATESLAKMYGIDIPEEVYLEEQNVFQQAKNSLKVENNYDIPKGLMTYAEYRALNKRVIKTPMPLNMKVKEFDNLDMMAGLVVSGEIKLAEV